MQSDRPEMPLDALREAAAGHVESNAALGDFHAELSSADPDPAQLEKHAARLRALPAIVGPFERWYLNPRVQAFIAELNATGI
jgi:hypothetical protein